MGCDTNPSASEGPSLTVHAGFANFAAKTTAALNILPWLLRLPNTPIARVPSAKRLISVARRKLRYARVLGQECDMTRSKRIATWGRLLTCRKQSVGQVANLPNTEQIGNLPYIRYT